MTDKEKINKAFRKFHKEGYFAEQKFLCCMTCGLDAIPDGIEKYVFYHRQDAEAFEGAWLKKNLHLAWSGNGQEICDILHSCGLETIWDGSEDTRIAIKAV